MKIYCCACAEEVDCRLTSGREIYPHRADLSGLPFWKHDKCGNFVGCHHKTSKPTKPLGCIPTAEIRELRKKIHATLDPLWRNGDYGRKEIYRIISERMGGQRLYHTAEIRSADEAREVLAIIHKIQEGK